MNDVKSIVNRLVAGLVATLLLTVGWLIQVGITDMSRTLVEIRHDVGELNKDSLLLQQKVDFQLQWMRKEVSRVRDEFDAHRREHKHEP